MIFAPIVSFFLIFPFPQDSDFVVQEQFRVEFVLLDVVALDRSGRLIEDLKITDFEVRENRDMVDIAFFDVLDFRRDDPPDLSKIPEEYRHLVPLERRQQVIVALDLESVDLLTAQKAFGQVRDFLNDLDPKVHYQINLYSLERGSITQGFVDRTEDVIAALNDLQDRHNNALERIRGGTGRDPVLLGEAPRRGRGGRDGMLTVGANSLSDLERAFRDCVSLNSFDPASRNRCIDESAAAFAEDQRFRTERIIGELESLTYKFQDVDGLKMMLLVSPGFALNNMASIRQLAAAYKEPDGFSRADQVFLEAGTIGDSDRDFRRVIHACIKNRVIFHTFDIFNGAEAQLRSVNAEFGGATPRTVSQAYRSYSFEVTDGLRELAEESGGTFSQVATLKGAMNKTIDRNQFYYVLGYYSPEGKPGKYRRIKIKAKGKKVELRYRAGYFGS